MVTIVNSAAGAVTGGAPTATWGFTPTAGNTLILLRASRNASTDTPPSGWVEDLRYEPFATNHMAAYVWRKASAVAGDTGFTATDAQTITQWRVFEVTGLDASTINTATANGGQFDDTDTTLTVNIPAGDFTFGIVGVRANCGTVDWGAVANEATGLNASGSMGSYADDTPAGVSLSPSWPNPGRVTGAMVSYLETETSSAGAAALSGENGHRLGTAWKTHTGTTAQSSTASWEATRNALVGIVSFTRTVDAGAPVALAGGDGIVFGGSGDLAIAGESGAAVTPVLDVEAASNVASATVHVGIRRRDGTSLQVGDKAVADMHGLIRGTDGSGGKSWMDGSGSGA